MQERVSFEEWMRQVNNAISDRLAGLTSDDLPDCCYRDWYDEGLSVRQAALRAIHQIS